MNRENMNRSYLETLSFSDLVKLADEYDVEIPDNLDRRFLIAELLELYEEEKSIGKENMVISTNDEREKTDTLPKNYNENEISCVLRNPAWLFVFWNLSESDSAMLKSLGNYTLMLRVCSLSSPDEQVPEEAFEIQAAVDSQEQYVLIPQGKKYIKVELVYVTATTGKILAFSPVIEIPQGADFLNDLQPGKKTDFSDIIKLSGEDILLMSQYKNHRHSFSNV
ncbi:MAG: DUF4912 domain-containing protein [Treponema sp.]|nr:DUF4912 domain-containing protein [Treponema sp.]